MTSPGLLPGCSVWVDGVRMADGQPGESDLEPVALTNLRVVWGRDSTLDQPNPATCSFEVLDIAGGKQFLEVLGIGKRLTVRAEASIYPDPTVSTIVDPGFELAAAGSSPSTRTTNATVVVSTAQKATGAHSARVDPVDATRSAVVIFPPAAFDPIPSAWDDIPRVAGGQSWRFGASVKLAGAPAAFVLNPVYFTSPNPAVPYVIDRTAVATQPAPGGTGWVVASGDVTPPADVWVGLALTVYPHGPAWVDYGVDPSWAAMPAGVAWQDLASTFVDDLLVLAPAAGALRAGAVFDGRVTDMTARYSTDVGGTIVEVIAQDETAELANRYVGAAPFPLESLLTRFGRIVNESGQALQYIVDPGAQPFSISWQDVDSQPATGLLQRLAQSVTGVLWSATSLASGPYLRLEDVNSRPPLYRLTSTPAVLRNLFTRPSFEDGSASGWQSSTGTLSVPTVGTPATPGAGTRVLRNTTTAGPGPNNTTLVVANRPAVTVGKLYRATVWVRTAVNGGTATFRVDGAYRDSTGASIGSGYNSGISTLNSATWRRVTLNFPAAPSNAVTMSLALNVTGAATTGQAFEYDAIMVHEIAAASDPDVPYFDGDTVDAGGAYYTWDGTVRNSTSTRSGTLTVGVSPIVNGNGIELDACSVLLEPVRWQQDSTDDATRVVISWLANAANPTPPPAIQITGHDFTVSDPELEATTGRRRVQVSTMLALESEAQTIAVQLLARLQTPGWRLTGLTVDLHYETLDPAMLSRIMRILDASTRLGLPILLTGLPEWSPAGSGDQALYLEGGRFTYDTAWRLELLVSSAAAQGQSALRWVDMPAYVPWESFDPAISWNDLQGVGI